MADKVASCGSIVPFERYADFCIKVAIIVLFLTRSFVQTNGIATGLIKPSNAERTPYYVANITRNESSTISSRNKISETTIQSKLSKSNHEYQSYSTLLNTLISHSVKTKNSTSLHHSAITSHPSSSNNIISSSTSSEWRQKNSTIQMTASPVQSAIMCTTVITVSSLCLYSTAKTNLITTDIMPIATTTAIENTSSYYFLTSAKYSTSLLPKTPTSIIFTASSKDISNMSSSFYETISVSVINITSATSAIIKSAHVLTPAIPIMYCDRVVDNFSAAISNFTNCVLTNLHPMEVCFQCFKQYYKLKNYHKDIYKDCKNHLISRYNHKYQVVSQMFDMQRETWNSLDCEKCYNYDTDPPQQTKDFKIFQRMFQNTMECFRNESHIGMDSTNQTNITGNVCIDCKEVYSKLQLTFKFQEDSIEEYKTRWCADINVAVNETRHKWNFYKCVKKEKDLISIIALTCFFCFLPIIFYVGTKLHSDVKERKSNRYYESE